MYIQERNGKFRAFESYDYLGKRKTVSVTMDRNTTASRKEAQRVLAQLIADATASIRTDKTVSDLAKLYLAEQIKTVKLSTYRRNESACRVICRLIGDVQINKLTAGYVRQQLLQYSDNKVTLNEYITRFKAMLRWGCSMEYVKCDDLINHLTKFPTTSKKSRIADKYLEPAELKEVIKHSTEYYSPVIEFLALSGLRIGELIALDDSDVGEKYISITKNYDTNNRIITTPKTAESVRQVFITSEMRNCIAKIRSNSKQFRLISGNTSAPYFIVSVHGTRLSYIRFAEEFRNLTVKVVGRQLSPHSLRHTCASIFASRGIPLETISRRLGHSNSVVTREVYLHATKDVVQNDEMLLAAVSFL